MTEERVARRWAERHGAAAVRAVSGRPDAEWRAQRLSVGNRRVPVATPYLVETLDSDDDGNNGGGAAGTVDLARIRGVADGLGMLLRHSDLDLHAELSPSPLLERIIFDALEQLRCDSLTPDHLRGQRRNLINAFDAWSLGARANRIGESRTGLLVFTIVHMANARLMARTLPEDVDELIEATRFHLAPVIGHALRVLSGARHDQRAYAEAAAEIARLVNDVAGDTDEADVDELASRHRLVIPIEWVDSDSESFAESRTGVGTGAGGSAASDTSLSLDAVGDYRVFTSEHDRIVDGASLHRSAKLDASRRHLDEMIRSQAVSVPRLAGRLLALLGSPDEDGWAFGRDHGVLDGRRLSRLVTSVNDRELFMQRRPARTSNTAVTFLVDNSGSMKRQRFEAVAVLMDTFSRALDLAGITNEVLGFTTGAWGGGRCIDEWRSHGEPADPGRMNEALHVVYKSADSSWRRQRESLAALATTDHFREGLDGEALAWAHGRLIARPEPRKILVMVTDGSPNDAATANVNRIGYLDDHLTGVAERIERHHRATGRGVDLGAIDIDTNAISQIAPVARTSRLDLSGTLTLAHYAALDDLLAGRRVG